MFWAVWGFLWCLMILGILERSIFFSFLPKILGTLKKSRDDQKFGGRLGTILMLPNNFGQITEVEKMFPRRLNFLGRLRKFSQV